MTLKPLFVLTLLVTLGSVLPVKSEISPEKNAAIQKLFEVQGQDKLMQQGIHQMIQNFRKLPQIPPQFWDDFEQKINTSELLQQLAPVYDKYYSLEDIQGLIAFYETPIGKKLLATTPQVMQESMKIGQEYGQKIAQQAMEEIKAQTGAPGASSSPTPPPGGGSSIRAK